MPTSDKKRETCLRNAQSSTGPKSAAGKERSSGNAFENGLFVRRVLPGEEELYEQLLKGLADYFRAFGLPEQFYVERIAMDMLRLLRLEAAEYVFFRGGPDDERDAGPVSLPRLSEPDLRKVRAHIDKKLASAKSPEAPAVEDPGTTGDDVLAEKPPLYDWHARVLEGIAPAGQGGSLTHLLQTKCMIEGSLQRKIKFLVGLQELRTTINLVPSEHHIAKARMPRRKRSDKQGPKS